MGYSPRMGPLLNTELNNAHPAVVSRGFSGSQGHRKQSRPRQGTLNSPGLMYYTVPRLQDA